MRSKPFVREWPLVPVTSRLRPLLLIDHRPVGWLYPRWHQVGGKLWYLQHNCVGDTIVYHKSRETWHEDESPCEPFLQYWPFVWRNHWSTCITAQSDSNARLDVYSVLLCNHRSSKQQAPVSMWSPFQVYGQGFSQTGVHTFLSHKNLSGTAFYESKGSKAPSLLEESMPLQYEMTPIWVSVSHIKDSVGSKGPRWQFSCWNPVWIPMMKIKLFETIVPWLWKFV